MFWRWRRRLEIRWRSCARFALSFTAFKWRRRDAFRTTPRRHSGLSSCAPTAGFASFEWRRRAPCRRTSRRKSGLLTGSAFAFAALERRRRDSFRRTRRRHAGRHSANGSTRFAFLRWRKPRWRPARGWTPANSWPLGRMTWRWNSLRIFRLNLLFKFAFVLNTLPAALNLWLCDFRFHGLRLSGRGRCGEFRRRCHQ